MAGPGPNAAWMAELLVRLPLPSAVNTPNSATVVPQDEQSPGNGEANTSYNSYAKLPFNCLLAAGIPADAADALIRNAIDSSARAEQRRVFVMVSPPSEISPISSAGVKNRVTM